MSHGPGAKNSQSKKDCRPGASLPWDDTRDSTCQLQLGQSRCPDCEPGLLEPAFHCRLLHSRYPIYGFRMWSLSQIVDVLSVLSHSLPDRPDRTAASSFSARLAALIHSSFQILTKVTNSATRWLLDRPASFKSRFELRLGGRSFCSRRQGLPKTLHSGVLRTNKFIM